VIYLTTSNRYDAAADSVVSLPGPTAVDDGTTAADREPVATAEGALHG
jgi:hypothetical protein